AANDGTSLDVISPFVKIRVRLWLYVGFSSRNHVSMVQLLGCSSVLCGASPYAVVPFKIRLKFPAVRVPVLVGVGVAVAVAVIVGVAVKVGVTLGVPVDVGVRVSVGICVPVAVGVDVSVAVAVELGVGVLGGTDPTNTF